jgi:hypothetical protein
VPSGSATASEALDSVSETVVSGWADVGEDAFRSLHEIRQSAKATRIARILTEKIDLLVFIFIVFQVFLFSIQDHILVNLSTTLPLPESTRTK